MGFAASASFAQGVADVCVARAGLPPARRLRQGGMPPKDLPCFGVMMDDVWALDEENAPEEPAADWLEAVAAQWQGAGLTENEKKRVVNAPNEEVQGMVVREERHWWGLS
eukprot:1517845-Lingulodinium_polyedra.AAC.1